MSRTYKDKPSKFRFDSWNKDRILSEIHFHWIYLPTTKTKKRKELDTEDHWMSTPSWWTSMTMNRPERRKAHLLEKKALKIDDLEDFDMPDLGRKPHNYYW